MQRNPLWRWVPGALSLGLVVVLPSSSLALEDAGARLPAPRLLSPLGAIIRQNDPDAGCPDYPNMGYGHRIEFEWEPVEGAAAYEIEARHARATVPLARRIVGETRLERRFCNGYVVDFNRKDWRWRVRAFDDRERVGPWSEWATFEFARCRLADGRTCGIHPTSGIAPPADPPASEPMLRVVNPRSPEERPARLTAPEPKRPANGVVVHGRDRELLLSWEAVPGAVGYEVYVDCLHCCCQEVWCSEVGGFENLVHRTEAPSYVFHRYGARDWRWRVWAVDRDGRRGPMSEWRSFRYSR